MDVLAKNPNGCSLQTALTCHEFKAERRWLSESAYAETEEHLAVHSCHCLEIACVFSFSRGTQVTARRRPKAVHE
jgi:hypothetical protein